MCMSGHYHSTLFFLHLLMKCVVSCLFKAQIPDIGNRDLKLKQVEHSCFNPTSSKFSLQKIISWTNHNLAHLIVQKSIIRFLITWTWWILDQAGQIFEGHWTHYSVYPCRLDLGSVKRYPNLCPTTWTCFQDSCSFTDWGHTTAPHHWITAPNRLKLPLSLSLWPNKRGHLIPKGNLQRLAKHSWFSPSIRR